MNTIKTFPLKFTSDKLNEIKIAAATKNKTMKAYIEDLINDDLKKVKK